MTQLFFKESVLVSCLGNMIIGLKTRQFYRDFLTAKQVLEVTMEIVDGILNKTQKNYNA